MGQGEGAKAMSRIPDYLNPPAIKQSIVQLCCVGCGAEANASCNCGKPYVPKLKRATEYAEQNPTASVREIAQEAGVGHGTAQEAKARVRDRTPDAVTTGLDGKGYPAKKHKLPPLAADDTIVNEFNVLIDGALELTEQMTDEQRADCCDDAIRRLQGEGS
jgi:hypothetical protein